MIQYFFSLFLFCFVPQHTKELHIVYGRFFNFLFFMCVIVCHVKNIFKDANTFSRDCRSRTKKLSHIINLMKHDGLKTENCTEFLATATLQLNNIHDS